MKLYVDFKRPKTIKEFITKIFVPNTNNPQSMIYLYGIKTYSDKECTKLQCHSNKFRSFDDILTLTKTYYPSITPKRLMHELLISRSSNLVRSNETKYLYMGICSTMQRIRLYYSTFNSHQTQYQFPTKLKLSSKYSWHELLKMIGIKNSKQLSAYLIKYSQKVVTKKKK